MARHPVKMARLLIYFRLLVPLTSTLIHGPKGPPGEPNTKTDLIHQIVD